MSTNRPGSALETVSGGTDVTIPIDNRIIGCELGDKPPWREPGWDEDERNEVEPNHAHAGPVAAMAAGNEDIPY